MQQTDVRDCINLLFMHKDFYAEESNIVISLTHVKFEFTTKLADNYVKFSFQTGGAAHLRKFANSTENSPEEKSSPIKFSILITSL